jgi:hypothetical protein
MIATIGWIWQRCHGLVPNDDTLALLDGPRGKL